ncbi:hypothetical protein KK062_05790 [Fulvivirgaceae bacterium PWU5]|uniref:DoxX family protein n=1 Tax=Dawidia cretensis TaxID=2782350 RepID=A0AAP2DUD8_9BACT|nr:hypothetical protein [Dawidia cretensis]MBT1707720.1 hypothetical protein [Dawidia cretensis]
MESLSNRLHYLFRIACAMCFIGHGAFGIITKQIWCNYFGVFGIGEALAYQLMPVVGIVDILLGLILIVYPIRAAAAWLVFWGLFTASLRPLSGEPFAEFLERAGNWGAPLILLMLSGPIGPGIRSWFKKMEPGTPLSEKQLRSIELWLKIIACTLLVGHGWLNLIEKKGLINQYISLGFHAPVLMAHIVGFLEVACGLSFLIRPVKHVVLVFFVWKMTSELFYPAWELFEWVERGGSYAALLGLFVVLHYRSHVIKLVPRAGLG